MQRQFQLTRVYSIASLIGIGFVAFMLTWYYRTVSVDALLEHETQFNIALAQAMANTIWPQHSELISTAGQVPTNQLVHHPDLATLDRDVRQKVQGLGIVKVKIYNLDGLTIYSSEHSQIGENKSSNAGFQRARAGDAASELVYRDRFSAFEQQIENRNVLSSYVPVNNPATGYPEGVFEIYSDVTQLVNDSQRTGNVAIAVVTGLSFLLYAFLLIIVRRADIALQLHEDEERKMQRDQIRHLAYHDVLTGLANRSLFKDRLQMAVARAQHDGKFVGLLFLDLNRFKVINDTLGHENGDHVLVEAATRIEKCVRAADTVCRMGGDEFVVVLDTLCGPHEAEQVAQRIVSGFSESMHIANREIFVSPSIGIAIYPKPTNDPSNLLSDAGAAMRYAKHSGRHPYAFYNTELDERARQNTKYELALRGALENREFLIYYQPRVDLEAGKVECFEALLRWRRPNKTLVPPVDFVPLLEDTGLIIPVGEWLIREACAQCQSWHAMGYRDLSVAVNLSPRQFRSESLVRTVRDALAGTGLPAHCLEFELTESVLVDDADQAIRQLRELKEIGIAVSIDDFGVGYSSLSYLRQFPVDHIKIDRSFVKEVPQDAESVALISAIAAMARSLRRGVIAEGIETWEQANFLRSINCNVLQGYLFSAPVPAIECQRLLASDFLRLAGRNFQIEGQESYPGLG